MRSSTVTAVSAARPAPPRRLAGALVAVTALVAGVLTVATVAAPAASAAVSPVVQPGAGVVTDDALPTAQIDGVAWTQLLVGNTVYVGGSFATARPAGAAPGTQTVPRPNLMSYDVTTGVMTSWAPSLNNQVYALAVSPDGSRLYVAGQFTTVNGVSRSRIAAFDTATGALVSSFAPKVNYIVKTLAVTDTTVYAGGQFGTVGSVTRNRLAAFDATTGATLPWDPNANGTVQALVLTPDKTKVIAGGAFTNVGGTDAYGLAALDPSTGAVLPWAAGQTVRNAGANAAILTLTTDGQAIYGTGYTYGSGGNLEGAFAADPTTGAIRWVEDCHGDTYGVFSTGAAVYTVSHSHYCGNVGGFPQTNPWSFQRALAWTPQATGTLGADPLGYFNWAGTPSPSMINWFPNLAPGSYTGVTQAAWSVAGDSRYVVLGGEFPTVNSVAQQGLVRFAVAPIAPSKDGPRLGGSEWTPRATAVGSSIRVSWPANWDRDDTTLTYTVIRNSATGSPAYTVTANSTFWNRPTLGFVDSSVAAGATATYRVIATDPHGNSVSSATVSATAGGGAALSAYATQVLADGAADYWRLSGSPASGTDLAGVNDLTLNGGVTGGVPGAIAGDADTAAAFDGSSSGFAATTTAQQGPNVFTVEAWVKTTSTAGGKIVGFGDSRTGNSSNYDRHVYMDQNGQLWFGVYNNAGYTVRTPTSYNDGQWHQVVGTLGPAGLAFYVDGKRIGVNTGTTVGQNYAGYWRVGGDSPWSGNGYLQGAIDDVAVYPTVLTGSQVRAHYTASGRSITGAPAPTDRYGTTIVADDPDAYLRLSDTGSTALDASGYGNNGKLSGGVTTQVASPVTPNGTGMTFNGVDGTVAVGPFAGPSTYSTELWFSTTTTRGGKLIGFGSSASGWSGSYDRHVYLRTDGRLVFGTWTGQANLVVSNATYNDGRFHHVVATQGANGMALYVDDVLVGTNATTGQQAYDGWWRIGGDSGWDGTGFFAGTIDDVAVYPTVLTPTQVDAHFHASPVGGIRNQPPVAAFTSSTSALTASFDASGSSDPDGRVTAYAWDFGDGTTGTGATASHTYGGTGTWTVTLTVTDDLGATAQRTATVSTVAPNQPPAAAFTAATSGLTASVDGSASRDTDGTVVGYAWTFGDGASASGPTASHAYAAGGTFPVTLTVTDDRGATASTTQSVTVTAPVTSTLARDTFARTTTGGWGSADTGGAWTLKGPAKTAWSVASGSGRSVLTPGATASAELTGVSATASDSTVDMTLDKAPDGGGVMLWIAARHNGSSDYRLRTKVLSTGAVQLTLSKAVNGTETVLASGNLTGTTFTAGTVLRMRLVVTGTTTTSLAATVWNAAGTAPAAPQLTATDTTSPLPAGDTWLSAYLSGSATTTPLTWSVANLAVVTPGA